MAVSPIQNLPDEILFTIFQDRDADPITILKVCKKWRDILYEYNDSLIFRNIYKKYSEHASLKYALARVGAGNPCIVSTEKRNYRVIVQSVFQFIRHQIYLLPDNYKDQLQPIANIFDVKELKNRAAIAFQKECEDARIVFREIAEQSPLAEAFIDRLKGLDHEQIDKLEKWVEAYEAPLSEISCLSLECKKLSFIPSWISKLKSLQTLSLKQNQIKELPIQIGDLSRLEILHLERNNIQKLPSEMCKLCTLMEIHVHDNPLHELPEEMVQLTSLKRIYAGPHQFKKMPEIPFLSICWVSKTID